MVFIPYRDIYYKDPALFGKQSVVDRYVDDIASTFQVPRSSLNVVFQRTPSNVCAIAQNLSQVAAAKGLFAGAFIITRAGNVVMDGSRDCDACRTILISGYG